MNLVSSNNAPILDRQVLANRLIGIDLILGMLTVNTGSAIIT